VKDVTALPLKESGGVSPEPLPVPNHRIAVRSLDFKVTSPRTVRGVAAGPAGP
jgi:hypothetical protein